MLFRYLRRELVGRRKATIIVSAGFAVAIALVMVVNSLSAGVRDAQAESLQSVYGVGTDITVTAAQMAPGAEGPGGNRFDFGADEGQTQDGTTSLSASRLTAGQVIDDSLVSEIASLSNVARTTAVLSLTNMTFSGEMPDPSQMTMPESGAAPGDSSAQGNGGGAGMMPGGPDGAGGSSFGIESFTVFGVDPDVTDVGPLSATALTDGRLFTADDATADVALLDETYATAQGLSVGDTIAVGDGEFEIVGVISSTSAQAETAANVYIPLAVAQSLAGQDAAVSTIYVQATSASEISALTSEIGDTYSDVTVASQEELAQSVAGSLQSATTLMSQLGLWLAIIVLAVALVLAVLFTLSGVSRRTRELGTLKALGWSNRRVMGQIAGESVAQGLLGAVGGVIIGLAVIITIGIVRPTISTSAATESNGFGSPGGMGGMGGGGMGSAPGLSTSSTTDLVLSAPLTGSVILSALAVAIIGGVVAGVIGGWRAARLSPADALRAVN